ncbi:MAG: hypothetical protein SPK94_07265 [Bacteroidales bacterium]|nr:hypothetical protein [Bacteroidales bacterium]
MRKKIIQIVSVIFIGIGTIIPIVEDKQNVWCLSFWALIIGTIGSVFSASVPNKYVLRFTIEDWNNTNQRDYFIIIKKRKHGMGKNPISVIYRFNEISNRYEEVVCEIENDKGNIILRANSTFTGKVVIIS